MPIQIIYHPKYLDYNFGPGHPFWSERAEVFLDKIKNTNITYKLREPTKATTSDLLLVHTQKYIEKVKSLAKERGKLSIDTPVNPQILEAAFYSVGGSILASNLALKKNLAINLLGGLHHAGINQSSGFCIFNDHSVAIKKLQKQNKINQVLIYDLDVHADQGTQEIFYDDPTVYTISIHQNPKTIYPGTGFPDQRGKGEGKGYNKNIILSPGSKEKEYLSALDSVLPISKQYEHDLVILVLGADTYKKDPLAQIELDENTYYKIGQRFKRFDKLAIMFAGGYSKKTPDLWLTFLNGLLS